MRNTFAFGGKNGIVVSSDFDGGNLALCQLTTPKIQLQQNYEESKVELETEENDAKVHEFDIWLCPDGSPYNCNQKQRAYFNFSVTGIPDKVDGQDRVLSFRLMNTSNQAKLLSFGHRPFYVHVNAKDYREAFIQNKLPTFELNWQRIPSECEYRKVETGLELQFRVPVGHEVAKNDFICVSYVLPYTLSDINLSITKF